MSTAESTTFADSISTLGDRLVKLKVLEVLQLTKYLKETYNLEAAAVAVAAPVAAAAVPPRGRPPAKTEFDVVLGGDRAQQDSGHQGGAGGHDPRPQGGQGPGRSRSQGSQDRPFQGGRREAQEGARGNRRDREDQIILRAGKTRHDQETNIEAGCA